MSEKKDTQSRKWLLTINNPADKGFTHDEINRIMNENFKSVTYYCMADEVGEKGTPHTHLFICARSGIRFSTVKKNFPPADIESCSGSARQNRDYVTKSGKWEKDKKHETCVEGSFEEHGEFPVERKGTNYKMEDLYSMIKDGYSNYQILELMPESMVNLDRIEAVRQTIIQETYKDTWRNLHVTYIYGDSGTGKTRSVMDKYGYSNVFRVTDYRHPFDNYKGQDVVIFEEFRSSLPLSDMLCYLDGYPLELPCRYANKYACFTKVFIISNINIIDQYKQEPNEDRTAFVRRIHDVYHYRQDGYQPFKITFLKDGFRLLLNGEFCPFKVGGHDVH